MCTGWAQAYSIPIHGKRSLARDKQSISLTHVFVEVRHEEEGVAAKEGKDCMRVHHSLVPEWFAGVLRYYVPLEEDQEAIADPLGDPWLRQQRLYVLRQGVGNIPVARAKRNEVSVSEERKEVWGAATRRKGSRGGGCTLADG